jgi:YD repeat-containing protein
MRIAVLLLLLLFLPSVAAEYKPYLHTPVVPEHPEVRLFGQYNTLLFPGAATYAYSLEFPPGVNGLKPAATIAYNSQSQRSSQLGLGWSMDQNYIYRDVNGTVESAIDDKFILVFENAIYELVYQPEDGQWHTEVEYQFQIVNESGYWVLTKKNGVQYRFGYTSDAALVDSSGTVRWSLDTVTDTFGNTIVYGYDENPYAEDAGAVYLRRIAYNTDEQREILFSYETAIRPERRRTYEQGVLHDESRRLEDIQVIADDTLVRRYRFEYITLGPGISTLSTITRFGADNSSILHTANFSYYVPEAGYAQNSTWISPVSFGNDTYDTGVRFVDVNNDGFADIIQGRTSTAEKRAWINTRSGWTENSSWAPPTYIVDGSGNDLGVRFADVDNDGFTDMLTAKDSTRQAYRNTGNGWSMVSWSIPIDFASGTTDQGVQLADVNNDGKVDLVKGNGTRAVYLGTGSGWSSSSWIVPTDFYTTIDTGARLVDVNADGLPDITLATTTQNSSWLNNGSGWVNSTTWHSPVPFKTGSNADNGVRFIDVNGDGLVDVVQHLQSGGTINNSWINNGSGWTLNNSWVSPAPFASGQNTARRLADVNADGATDILTSNTNASTKTISYPYLIKEIRTEYGGRTTVTYTTSTQYSNTGNDSLSDIGFNIFVVSSIRTENGMNSTFNVTGTMNYTYDDGVYNYEKREFRGFSHTIERKISGTFDHYFYQDHARRGKEHTTIVNSTSGAMFAKNVRDFNYTNWNGVYNITVLSSTDYQYDGLTAPRIINTSYNYDWFNNPRSITEHGDVDSSGDERYTNYTYAYNKQAWIMDRQARITVYDADRLNVGETTYLYDDLGFAGMGSQGALTTKEEWNDNGNNTVITYTYDAFGNIHTATDSAGNIEERRYDDTRTFVSKSINPLGHITRYDHDLGTGNLISVQKNGITTLFEHDTHGRMVKEIRPGDSSQMPTKRYSYAVDGVAPEFVNISLRTTANKSMDSTYVYDGFGSLVQLQLERENDEVVKNLYYDALSRVIAEDNPYLANKSAGLASMSSVNQTNYTYDALDRVVSVHNPDGTSKNVAFALENITDYDENSNRHMYVIDGLGRIIEVHEYNNDPHIGLSEEEYVTAYSYDGNDNLARITDELGNQLNFTYDSLSRKISMEDPDMGTWTYTYDTRGNLVLQTDNRGQNIALSYDALNRIVTKSSEDVNYTFAYDAQYQGILTNLTMNSVSISYLYDERMRPASTSMSIEGVQFTMTYLYDSQDRLISQEGIGELDYLFDKQGKVQSIPGYVNGSAYNAFGSITNRSYANGITTTFAYNETNNRLTRISSSVQDLQYTYDAVGNILSINDVTNGKLHSMTYDNLDRMTSVTIGDDRYVYRYNPVGNIMGIVENNASRKFVYDNLAHAPSSVIETGAGADVYRIDELAGSKNRTVEFFVVNDRTTNLTGVNVSVTFGDGKNFTKSNLTVDDSVMFLVENNYTYGGDYRVNVSVNSSNTTDHEAQSTKFGIRATGLSVLGSNVSAKTFEWKVASDVADTLVNVSWNCSEGINFTGINISNASEVFDYLQHNYTSPGTKSMTCTAYGLDGNETRSITLVVEGLEVRNYDVLVRNISRRVIGFDAYNGFHPLEMNISVQAEDGSFSSLANISTGESVLVFAEVNNTPGEGKVVHVGLASGAESTEYISVYDVKTAVIEEYDALSLANTTSVSHYIVRNEWYDGVLSWNLSEAGVANSTAVESNGTLLILVENQYDQGTQQQTMTATVAGLDDIVQDAFDIDAVVLSSLLVLQEGSTTVSELGINSYIGAQNVTWSYDTGVQNITNTTTVDRSLFVFVQHNYSTSAVYRVLGKVNSSIYSDNRSAVVIS